ncbi:hypothetical protein [Burkholderia sp. TSV86]|uniref:hypothetical protein n=1 Tax=Burkholderia sp. TSV86 TaxID=1385594 RepID=UPI0012E34D51|nr:hypothetical protein [Burkholderia sp. TSV86]
MLTEENDADLFVSAKKVIGKAHYLEHPPIGSATPAIADSPSNRATDDIIHDATRDLSDFCIIQRFHRSTPWSVTGCPCLASTMRRLPRASINHEIWSKT